jgi:hypothetical protein
MQLRRRHIVLKICEYPGASRVVVEITEPGCGRLFESNLHAGLGEEDEDDTDDAVSTAVYNAVINGIESFLLALACEGVDISTPAFGVALQTAVDAAANNL